MPRTGGRGDTRIEVDGLTALRRDLRTVDVKLGREVGKAIRSGMKPTIALAAQLAPHRSGKLAASLRPRASKNEASIVSKLPYANVIHWGGNVPDQYSTSTRPKRHFKARPFVETAIERRLDQLVDEVGGNVEALMRRHGFR